jgi:RimJ/RimL family protein N-acetyltransferase
MKAPVLSVRALEVQDIPLIANYWLEANPAYLRSLGADPEKIPDQDSWTAMLSEQLRQPVEQKGSYCVIWLVDGQPAGHSNVNNIVFGESAYMHLHLWRPDLRHKGLGVRFVQRSLPWFFKHLQLKKIYCEPYALNPAPNKTLERAGFRFVRSYRATPGSITFEQEVNLWEMTRERFDLLGLSIAP